MAGPGRHGRRVNPCPRSPQHLPGVGLPKRGAKWESHWAFRDPIVHTPPDVKQQSWVRNPIDAFILSRLEENGLTPAAPAEKIPLLRRAYDDLTGLPPAPAYVAAFLADPSPLAYEAAIERLLESPDVLLHSSRAYSKNCPEFDVVTEQNGWIVKYLQLNHRGWSGRGRVIEVECQFLVGAAGLDAAAAAWAPSDTFIAADCGAFCELP